MCALWAAVGSDPVLLIWGLSLWPDSRVMQGSAWEFFRLSDVPGPGKGRHRGACCPPCVTLSLGHTQVSMCATKMDTDLHPVTCDPRPADRCSPGGSWGPCQILVFVPGQPTTRTGVFLKPSPPPPGVLWPTARVAAVPFAL